MSDEERMRLAVHLQILILYLFQNYGNFFLRLCLHTVWGTCREPAPVI